MSSSQPGSLTPPPSASLEERIRETERGERDGGQRWRHEEAQGKTQGFSFFFFIFYTPAFSAWLPSCYNVKLPFLLVYREQCGTVTWRQEKGVILERGIWKREAKRWRGRVADHIMMGLKKKQRDKRCFLYKLFFYHEHPGNDNICGAILTAVMATAPV